MTLNHLFSSIEKQKRKRAGLRQGHYLNAQLKPGLLSVLALQTLPLRILRC